MSELDALGHYEAINDEVLMEVVRHGNKPPPPPAEDRAAMIRAAAILVLSVRERDKAGCHRPPIGPLPCLCGSLPVVSQWVAHDPIMYAVTCKNPICPVASITAPDRISAILKWNNWIRWTLRK